MADESGEPRRRLAVCVDDFGLDEGVNEAVLALARQGRISATSCMVGAPAWRTGAAALRALDPAALDVGLHLDLTEFPRAARLLRRAAVRAEIEAQLDVFERALGRPPAHVDGHRHVHQLPVVRAELLAALDARCGDYRPWLRRTRRTKGARFGGKAWLIEALGGGGLDRLAAAKGYRQNAHLLGVYDFRGDAERYLALLACWLREAEDGDLLMCHPATALVPGDAIAAARVWEYRVLAGPAFGALLAREGVRVGW